MQTYAMFEIWSSWWECSISFHKMFDLVGSSLRIWSSSSRGLQGCTTRFRTKKVTLTSITLIVSTRLPWRVQGRNHLSPAM